MQVRFYRSRCVNVTACILVQAAATTESMMANDPVDTTFDNIHCLAGSMASEIIGTMIWTGLDTGGLSWFPGSRTHQGLELAYRPPMKYDQGRTLAT